MGTASGQEASGQKHSWAAPWDFSPSDAARSLLLHLDSFFLSPVQLRHRYPPSTFVWYMLIYIEVGIDGSQLCSQLQLTEKDPNSAWPPSRHRTVIKVGKDHWEHPVLMIFCHHPHSTTHGPQLLKTWRSGNLKVSCWQVVLDWLQLKRASAGASSPREPAALSLEVRNSTVGRSSIARRIREHRPMPAMQLLICSGSSSKLWTPVEILPKTVSVQTQLQILN